jgi:hypothetical protein
MKSFVKYSLMACIALAMVSCVKDLDVKPNDPNSSQQFNQDAMFTKCYACLGVIGQSGPGEDSDVDRDKIDAGTSAFYRSIWYPNELTSDDIWWTYNDEESKQLTQTCWTGTNGAIWMIYIRLNLDIKYCNHYIANATTNNDEERWRMAEVRFIRALHYYYFMDFYLYAPFILDDANDMPHLKPRHEIYNWLVGELTYLEGALPPTRKNPYRIGKSAAQLLLARIYLNADVYNKYNPDWTPNQPQTWETAYNAADKVITDNDHMLVTESAHSEPLTDSSYVYSAYQRLFMGDNHHPDIMKESILQIYQDAVYCQNYGGVTLMIAGPRADGLNPCGGVSPWHSMRSSPTLVDKFIGPVGLTRKQAASIVLDEYQMPERLKDDRAILCSNGLNTKKKFTLKGPQGTGDEKNMYECWAPLKFTNVYSTAVMPKYSPRQNPGWPDTDIPFMRLAEAYLIKAEASARKSGSWNETDPELIANVKIIRDRAHATELPSISEEEMLAEWSREFYMEGRRRMDLIRFGRFFGEEANANKYHWEGRMAQDDGKDFKAEDESMNEQRNWFPIPSDDKRQNPNYKTDVEGDPNNKFASKGGDGYPY